MTVVTESETSVACLVGNLGDLHNRTGSCVRQTAGGAVLRIDDASARQAACLVIGPPHMDAVLRFLGIDPDSLPRPGEANDVL